MPAAEPCYVTAARFKFRYAGAAFLVALLAVAAVAALFVYRHDADTRALSAIAEQSSREAYRPGAACPRLERGRARRRLDRRRGSRRRTSPVSRGRLQRFIDDPTVAGISVTSRGCDALQPGSAPPAATPARSSTRASMPVRLLVESIPGAATPQHARHRDVVLEQAAPVSTVAAQRPPRAASEEHTRFTWWLALALALGGGSGLRSSPGVRCTRSSARSTR